VTVALSKGEAALDLLKLAEEHYEGASLEWSSSGAINISDLRFSRRSAPRPAGPRRRRRSQPHSLARGGRTEGRGRRAARVRGPTRRPRQATE
jgi:hypothetical protein